MPDNICGERPDEVVEECAAEIPSEPVLCLAEAEGRNTQGKAVPVAARSFKPRLVYLQTSALASGKPLLPIGIHIGPAFC